MALTTPSVGDALAEPRAVEARREEAAKQMDALLAELGYHAS